MRNTSSAAAGRTDRACSREDKGRIASAAARLTAATGIVAMLCNEGFSDPKDEQYQLK